MPRSSHDEPLHEDSVPRARGAVKQRTSNTGAMNPRWTQNYSGYQKYWSVFEVPDSWWKPAAERRAREPAQPSSFEKLKNFATGIRGRVFGAENQAVQEEEKMVLVFFDYGGKGSTDGHIPQTLELARALVKQGHTVHYFAQEGARAHVGEIGANFQPYDHTGQVKLADDKEKKLRHQNSVVKFDVDEAAIAQVKDQGGTIPESSSLPRSQAMLPAALYLLDTGLLGEVERLSPQCIVCDASLPWGRIVADKLNIPLVASSTSNYLTLTPGKDSSEEVAAAKLAEIDYIQSCVSILKDKYGVEYDATSVSHNYSEFTIVWTVPEFESDSASLIAKGVHFFGASFPPLSSRMEGGDTVTVVLGEELHGFPFASLRARKAAGEKVVLCSLVSESAEANREMGDALVAAFGGKGGITVVLGCAQQPESLPENFFGAAVWPQKTLLTLADVFVTQLDSVAVNDAAFVGVPMVGLPLTEEERFNADRVAALSIGTSIPVESGGKVDVAQLVKAVDDVDASEISHGCTAMKKMMTDYHEYLSADAAKDILAYIKMHSKGGEPSKA
eukprot:scaffold148_cov371-Prasinococcus_capsulatus_cf.AAC.16